MSLSPQVLQRVKEVTYVMKQLKKQGITFPPNILKEISDTFIKQGEGMIVDTGMATMSGHQIIVPFGVC